MGAVLPVLFSPPVHLWKEFSDGPRGTISETGERSEEKDQRNQCRGREALLLVDVREDNEWVKGHLPGAVHLGRGIIERDIEQRVPDANLKLVLYCGGGFRSALVAENLQKMGYHNVESMDGGWKGWLEAGLPIARD